MIRWWTRRSVRRRLRTEVYELPPARPADQELINLFQERDGKPTTVVMRDGQRFRFFDIGWGYDSDDEYAHVTTNCSPGVEGMPLDFFYTDEVVEVLDDDGASLFRAEGRVDQ